MSKKKRFKTGVKNIVWKCYCYCARNFLLVAHELETAPEQESSWLIHVHMCLEPYCVVV